MKSTNNSSKRKRLAIVTPVIILALVGGVYLLSRENIPVIKSASLAVVSKDNELKADEIFRLVNAERRVRELPELTIDPALQAVAQQRARDMAENTYFAHQNLEGDFFYDLFRNNGFSTGYACENLAIEFTKDEAKYLDSWLRSKKGHRECLLNSEVTRAGYGVSSIRDPSAKAGSLESYIVVGLHAAPPFETVSQDQKDTKSR